MTMRAISGWACLPVFLIGQAATTAACSGSPGLAEEEGTARRQQAVLNASYDKDLKYPFVGFVSSNTSTEGYYGWCSGVQLSCGAVLTAAHCVAGGVNTGSGSFHTRYHAGDCGLSEDGDSRGFTKAVIAPGYLPSQGGTQSDYQIAHDLAILPLGRLGTPDARKLARSLPYASLADIGSSVLGAGPLTEVGYGPSERTEDGKCLVDENCGIGSPPKYGVYRKYAELLPVHLGGVWSAIALQGIEGTMATPGDSGGPLLLGMNTVVGIQSSTNGTESAKCSANMSFAANVTHPEPGQWLRSQLALLDSDGDGTPDACDDCPEHPDDGYDADGDGVGDACDDCPCSATESRASNPPELPDNTSSDGDGRCGSCLTDLPSDAEGRCAALCPGFALDTCPNVVNDDAENCNLEAELAMGARVLGDACDPVPCPKFDSQEKSSAIVKKIPVGGASKGFEGYLYLEQSSTGRLVMTPMGARRSPEKVKQWANGGVITDPNKIIEFPVNVDSTEYRYCVDVQGLIDCFDPANLDDAKLRQEADREQEKAESVWHRIWVGPGLPKPSSAVDAQNPLDIDLNPYLASAHPPYSAATTRDRTWNWEDDFAYWSTSSQWKDKLPYGVPSEAGQGRGRLWVHANTTRGMDPVDAEQGIHGKASDNSAPQTGLANAVQDVSPIVTKSRYVIHKLLTRVPLNLDVTVRPCRTCGTHVTEPGTLEHPDWGYPLAQVPGGSPLQAQQVVTLPGIDSPTVLLGDGSLLAVSGMIGQGLQASLTLGVRWADAVEVDPAAGSGALAPSAVGLGSANNTIVERLYVRSGALLGQQDVSPTHGPLMRVAPPVGSNAGPEPRIDPVAVYSRSSRRLFLLGGRNAISGELVSDVWWADVDTGAWEKVLVKGFAPGNIIAATYSPKDRTLWILDEVGPTTNARARLFRLQPGTGQVEQLGQWPRTRRFDRHWLLLDRDGGVLLAASSAKVNKHVVLRLDKVAAALHVGNSFAGQHALALPPLIDADGYAFATLVASHKMPVVVRLKELSGGIGHWGGIGTCL